MSTIKDMGLAHKYEAELLKGLPGDGHIYQFHKPHENTFREGIVVEITPHDAPHWIGNFQPGQLGARGVFATPHDDVAGIVAFGRAYLVKVTDPGDYKIVPDIEPLFDVRSVPSRNVVILADSTRVYCLDVNGIRWRTRDLSWHGIRFTGLSESHIKGYGHDMPNQKDVEFVVDLNDGSHEGGSSSSS
jgi:hypothetical protein